MLDGVSIQQLGLFESVTSVRAISSNSLTHVFQKVVHTVKGDFAGNRLADNEKDDMELVPKHVEYGHGTEYDRGAELALHDDSAIGRLLEFF